MFLVMLPTVAIAKDYSTPGLVHCGISLPGAPVDPAEQCDFTDLMKLVQNALNFIIYQLATPIAVLMFAFAGFKLVTSGGDPKAESTARKIFTNTLIGYAVMLSSFLIIKLVFSFFFDQSFSLLG